ELVHRLAVVFIQVCNVPAPRGVRVYNELFIEELAVLSIRSQHLRRGVQSEPNLALFSPRGVFVDDVGLTLSSERPSHGSNYTPKSGKAPAIRRGATSTRSATRLTGCVASVSSSSTAWIVNRTARHRCRGNTNRFTRSVALTSHSPSSVVELE